MDNNNIISGDWGEWVERVSTRIALLLETAQKKDKELNNISYSFEVTPYDNVMEIEIEALPILLNEAKKEELSNIRENQPTSNCAYYFSFKYTGEDEDKKNWGLTLNANNVEGYFNSYTYSQLYTDVESIKQAARYCYEQFTKWYNTKFGL